MSKKCKVKEFEWGEVVEPYDYVAYNYVTTDTPLGVFSIRWQGWEENPTYSVYESPFTIPYSEFDTLDEAKDFAYNEFSKKIQSCLV